MEIANSKGQMDPVAVSGRIKFARKTLGLSQGSLAARLGVHRATIAHWERESGFVPSVENLSALSRELRVGFEWLAIGGIADEAKPEPSSTALSSRRDLEARLLELSRHVPVSFLSTVVSVLQSASILME
ncbi:helix-turn-helix transcriptional regulator [Xanthomonas oryzae]|uniref:helix-turn-helix transcriptional regulator n=1 Tax=Xanthomonas oryzae TaxID=347 RepID=UPI001F230CB2|nr:helix-turn-helix transcriptional regulator [Xanthomonas oryzae]